MLSSKLRQFLSLVREIVALRRGFSAFLRILCGVILLPQQNKMPKEGHTSTPKKKSLMDKKKSSLPSPTSSDDETLQSKKIVHSPSAELHTKKKVVHTKKLSDDEAHSSDDSDEEANKKKKKKVSADEKSKLTNGDASHNHKTETTKKSEPNSKTPGTKNKTDTKQTKSKSNDSHTTDNHSHNHKKENPKRTWSEVFVSPPLKANFCSECGALLDLTRISKDNTILMCQVCGLEISAKELFKKVVVTRSQTAPKEDDEEKDVDDADVDNQATIDELCPKCGHTKMYFTTAQVRSVDEGSTVFYKCVNCGYKFTSNN